ncbi:MAG: poly(A) polymerase [Planctomycetota bacterium]|jgi:poly(A) polymerase
MSQNFERAKKIVQRLKRAGHEAYFAGGCVRDHLLDIEPKDYDIATSAKPDEVEAMFSNTIGVGKQFGVIIVCSGGANFDVATFRADGNYGDGRHPDAITFSSAKEDVLRRDFTINGLLMEPETMEIVDHVGGRADLAAGVIRTIGVPAERFSEDHLRILRAVRFSCRLGFKIDPETAASMKHLADRAATPSAERIFGELDRTLRERAPYQGLKILNELGLLRVVLPEVAEVWDHPVDLRFCPDGKGSESVGERKLSIFSKLAGPLDSGLVWALLLTDLVPESARSQGQFAGRVVKRLRASSALIKNVEFLVTNRDRFLFACRVSMARKKLIAAHPNLGLVGQFVAAENQVVNRESSIARSFALEPTALPQPLLNGKELMDLGIPKGKMLGRVIRKLKFLQLNGALLNSTDACEWAKQQS